MLEREYGSLALRDPELGARYVERQADLRRDLGAAMEARARHLGTPDRRSPRRTSPASCWHHRRPDLDELIEPGSVRLGATGEALAIIYAGLVARAHDNRKAPPKRGLSVAGR